jgi:hypothetical protein
VQWGRAMFTPDNTADNTSGFTADELAMLNEARRTLILLGNGGDLTEDDVAQFVKSVEDALTNAFVPGIEFNEIVVVARKRLHM